MEGEQETEPRRSDRSTKGKSTPKYGTIEWEEIQKRAEDQFALLNTSKLNQPELKIKKLVNEGASTSAGFKGFLSPPKAKLEPKKITGSRASFKGSLRSVTSSVSTLKKKECEAKAQKEICKITEKISNMETDLLVREKAGYRASAEIEELEMKLKNMTEEKVFERKDLVDSITRAKRIQELEKKELEVDKVIVASQVNALKEQLESAKADKEAEKAKIDAEAEQNALSDEDDDAEDKVIRWQEGNKSVSFNETTAVQTQEQARQQRIEEKQRAEEESKRLLDLHQQQLALQRNMQQVQAEEAKITEQRRQRQSQTNVNANPLPHVSIEPAFTPYPVNTQFLARQSHGKDLPYFTGNPEEWLTFKGAYERTNIVCGFSPDENLNRLQKCLKGNAAKFVQSLMTTPINVPTIMRKLETRYGQPEFIIEALTLKVRNISALKQDNPEGIIEFGGAVDNLVTTLQALKRPDHLFNPILLKELESKMPLNWRMDWREWLGKEQKTKDLSSFSQWLEKKTNIVCELCPPQLMDFSEKNDGNHGNHFRNKRQGEKVMVAADVGKKNVRGQDAKPRTCLFCSIMGHRIVECRKFKGTDVQERLKFVKFKRLCFKCLNYGHRLADCTYRVNCGKDGCTRNHHQLIHEEWQKPPAAVPPEKKEEVQEIALHAKGVGSSDEGRVLYKILPLTFIGPNGEEVEDFIFMDGGSGLTILDNSVANELNLNRTKKPFKFEGLGYTGNRPDSCVVDFSVRSKHTGKVYHLKNVQTDDVNYLPQRSLSREEVKKYKYLQDIPFQFYKNAKPKLLLGIQHADLMETIQRTDAIGGKGPIAAETKLGWVLTGTLPPTLECPKKESMFFLNSRADDALHQMVKKHFTTEDFGVKISHAKVRSKEDERAESIMESTARRVNGKWEMGLLWKDDQVNLPGSRAMAERRLKSVEKRMDQDPEFSKVYVSKIQEYLDKGFVRKLSPEELIEDGKSWYLPHFGVVNPNKPGKFRLVFDAAAKSNGVSLNDKLLTGPDYVPSILSILFRFRQRAVAFTADISDMFHQVKMKKEDQSAQKFLWRGMDRDREPDVMVMQVMVFGAASSPSCAQYIKNRNAEEVGEKYPEAVKDIVKNHYVDDYLGSTDTVEEAVTRQQQVFELHQQGGFKIVKWISNSPEFNRRIPEELRAEGAKSLDVESLSFSERVLGLYWEPPEDKFTFKTIFHKIEKDVLEGARMPTKREALALVMSVFDPIGFLSLFTVKAKMILQETWRSKVEWDEELPDCVAENWMRWIKELQRIPIFRVPRCYSVMFSTAEVRELHVFVDASESAFAAVAYVKMIKGGQLEVSLVAAKSKVAPLKPLSIPRMELQAAVMGTRLATTIKKEHDYDFHETFYWSDSRTVLCWLESDGRRFQQFVAHRVGEIQETSEVSEWNWVPTADNVADEATRNVASDWGPNSRWVNGPKFLRKPRSEWPKPVEPKDTSLDNLELKREFVLIGMKKHELQCPIQIERFSTWLKLIRATAFVLRSVDVWTKKNRDRGLTGLKVPELRKAAECWNRWSQSQSYMEEIEILKNGESLKQNNDIAKLTPFLDENGILRMKGRIPSDANVYGMDRNPIILHPKNPYTKLLIAYYHVMAGHHGMERVVNELRQRYCIPNVRVAVKRAWHECQKCKLRRAEPVPPLMGDLPLARLNSFVHPFTVTGLDYFGPLEITVGRRREKRYGALFTCMSTRAVHKVAK